MKNKSTKVQLFGISMLLVSIALTNIADSLVAWDAAALISLVLGLVISIIGLFIKN